MTESHPASEYANGRRHPRRAETVLCRYPVRGNRVDAMRSELERSLREASDPERLVGIPGGDDGGEAYTVSVFLESLAGRSLLSWHVEGRWDRTDGTGIVEGLPLFDRLEKFLETDGRAAIEPTVYARHPERPTSVPRRTRSVPFLLGVDDHRAERPDVLVYRCAIRDGLPRRIVNGLQGLIEFFDGGRVERKFEEWSDPVIDEEGVYTETVAIERLDDGWYYLNYLECESRERVHEAFHESDSLVARLSEPVLRWTLADPTFLDRVPESPFELLIHAVNGRRP